MCPITLTTTSLPGIERVASGKVRDVYSVGDDLLIVATDRISAFDCILPQGIPGKGRVLTQMSLFWFDFLRGVVPNHVITADVECITPPTCSAYRDQLEGRSMLVKRCRMEPIECVARGYVSGSGWKDYKKTGAICGIPLPAGLLESDKLPEPIFTPATKAESGHDENISFEAAAQIIGRQTAALLRDLTLRIYSKAAEYAESRGIILADTKFEFGWTFGRMQICCSPTKYSRPIRPASGRATNTRPADRRNPSTSSSCATISKRSTGTNNRPRLPCPQDVIDKTAEKYREAYTRLTGEHVCELARLRSARHPARLRRDERAQGLLARNHRPRRGAFRAGAGDVVLRARRVVSDSVREFPARGESDRVPAGRICRAALRRYARDGS